MYFKAQFNLNQLNRCIFLSIQRVCSWGGGEDGWGLDNTHNFCLIDTNVLDIQQNFSTQCNVVCIMLVTLVVQ